MNDVVDKATRSRLMSGVRTTGTTPELIIRKSLFALGYRYRLNRRDLPGRPDIVLAKYRAAIFVHGCFWHGHDCHLFQWPRTNKEFWLNKISKNALRDETVITALLKLGWRVMVVWECALRGKRAFTPDEVGRHVADWLGSQDVRVQIRGKV